jgi:hypothetical protein
VWVSGLPEVATVITVGQELVVPGERVDVTFEAGSEHPIAVPRTDTQGAPENLAGENPLQGRATQANVEVGTG